MANLKSLSINDKDLTKSLTEVKVVDLISSGNIIISTTGVHCASIIRSGNVCELYVIGTMNKIPKISSWNSTPIISIPEGFTPVFDEFVVPFLCDGVNTDWTKNYISTIASNGKIYVTARTNAYDASSCEDGHQYKIHAIYLTKDEFPTD